VAKKKQNFDYVGLVVAVVRVMHRLSSFNQRTIST
jgi:hypothetical protein